LKDEEFIADFCLVSRRTLSPREHRLFRYHYLLGADWKLCCGKLNMERGAFFHEIYRIEQKLGRVFRELEPHALFPVDEYFNGASRYPRPSVAVLSPFGIESDYDDRPVDVSPRPKKVLKFPIKKVA